MMLLPLVGLPCLLTIKNYSVVLHLIVPECNSGHRSSKRLLHRDVGIL